MDVNDVAASGRQTCCTGVTPEGTLPHSPFDLNTPFDLSHGTHLQTNLFRTALD